ncbi:MAG: indole-3-glycerol phosphate synthase TrpC [Pseudanabaenaceae cyanobacterium]
MQIRRQQPAAIARGYAVAGALAQPANILEKIVWQKEKEVAQAWAGRPLKDLWAEAQQGPPLRDFRQALQQSSHQPALIAEVKKASPSRGVLRAEFDPVAIAQAYERGGAACLSVLTDETFFQGSFGNLERIRAATHLPLLCKEFIIDAHQILWARRCGADAVLLIAAILTDGDLKQLLDTVLALGMTPLVEVHSVAEWERVCPHVEPRVVVGINNRNLMDFSVDLQRTREVLAAVPPEVRTRLLWVGESGYFTAADLRLGQQWGVGAVLIGEALIRQPDPETAVQALLTGR